MAFWRRYRQSNGRAEIAVVSVEQYRFECSGVVKGRSMERPLIYKIASDYYKFVLFYSKLTLTPPQFTLNKILTAVSDKFMERQGMKETTGIFSAKCKSGNCWSALILGAAVVLCGTKLISAEEAGSVDTPENAMNIKNVKVAEKPGVAFDFSGYVAYQDGEIVRGMYGNSWDPLDHQWQNFFFGGFDILATVNKRLQITIGTEAELAQSVLDLSPSTEYAQDLDSYNMYYRFYADQMKGTYTFGDLDRPFLKATLGYFKYTYNHDVKSLGEYLFRATPYPGYIINSFASVYARLPGLCLEFTPIPNLKIDGMVTTETQYPVGDMTPSLVASYGFGGSENHPLVEVGAGVSFTRLISVNSHLTSPQYSQDQIIVSIDTAYRQTTLGVDTVVDTNSVYPSFASTKVMARFSFDPKQLFGAPSIFGDQDLKLYGEACILGTKDYPVLYDTIWKRIPVMLGFNIPVFKVLDVLSAEIEWYDSKYSNNYKDVYFSTPKLPQPVGGFEPAHFPWYWDIYFEKTIVNGLKVLGDFGRTHYFTTGNLQFYRDTREECPSKGDWQFTLRGQFSF
jgi:hypothetical protein